MNLLVVNVLVDLTSLEGLVTDVLLDFMDSDLMGVVHVNVITLDPWTTFVTLSPASASAGVTRMEDSVMNANQDSGTIQTVNDVTVTDTQILVTPRLEPVSGVEITLQDRIVKFVSEDSMEIH